MVILQVFFSGNIDGIAPGMSFRGSFLGPGKKYFSSLSRRRKFFITWSEGHMSRTTSYPEFILSFSINQTFYGKKQKDRRVPGNEVVVSKTKEPGDEVELFKISAASLPLKASR